MRRISGYRLLFIEVLHVFRWSDLHVFLEEVAECLRVADATLLCHLLYACLACCKKLCCLVNPIVVDELDERHSSGLFNFLVEGGMAHCHLVGKDVDVEVGVADVFVNYVSALYDNITICSRTLISQI